MDFFIGPPACPDLGPSNSVAQRTSSHTKALSTLVLPKVTDFSWRIKGNFLMGVKFRIFFFFFLGALWKRHTQPRSCPYTGRECLLPQACVHVGVHVCASAYAHVCMPVHMGEWALSPLAVF